MYRLPRIQDLPQEEIAELLEKQGQRVPAAIAPDLKIFIGEIDGIDNDETASELKPAA
jgi:hypothetical protein